MRLFNKSVDLVSSGLLRGFTDWHSHILPGVDDGVKTIEESLAILAIYEREGISEVWLTPHVMEDIPNTRAGLQAVFNQLTRAYTGRVRLRLASENMLDSLFDERLESGDLLPLPFSRLLVETSYYNPPMDMDRKLDRLKSKGYRPVLAHPERYMYMPPSRYAELRASGIEFQINLTSLLGVYGPEVQARATKLVEQRMFEYIGTDTHRERLLPHLLEGSLPKKIIEKLI